MSKLEMARWRGGPKMEGLSRWALRRIDRERSLTLPGDKVISAIWTDAVSADPAKALVIGDRYPWGCFVDIPIGIPTEKRLRFIDLVEGNKATVIPKTA